MVIPDLQAMKKAIRKHCKTCTAKPRSYPALIEMKLTNQIIHLAATNSFYPTSGGCAGHLKLGGTP